MLLAGAIAAAEILLPSEDGYELVPNYEQEEWEES